MSATPAFIQDALDMAEEHARILVRVSEAAKQAEREKYLKLLQAIFVAYDRAATDPAAKLPTPLMAAIVAARVAIGRPESS